jgi:hypothetical protein
MVTRGDLMKKCGLVGSGIGLALFAVFGLLQGAMLGGTAGIGIANYVFGANTFEVMGNDLLPRAIMAASMLAGVVISCVMFVVAGGAVGAAGGFALSLLRHSEAKQGEYAVETAPGQD